MTSDHLRLPNDVIRLILFYCQTPKDYLSQSLINHQWSHEAHALRSKMKTRFSRTVTFLNHRFIIWHFDVRLSVVGHDEHRERHGLEECVQTYHRVGGPGAQVYYLERHWQEGKLCGKEILREINAVWFNKYYPDKTQTSNEMIIHPYDGLNAVDSMRQYGRHCLVPTNSELPEGCDYLGKILYKYQWTSGALDESKQLKRNLIDENNPHESVSGLYEYVHEMDISQTPK